MQYTFQWSIRLQKWLEMIPKAKNIWNQTLHKFYGKYNNIGYISYI